MPCYLFWKMARLSADSAFVLRIGANDSRQMLPQQNGEKREARCEHAHIFPIPMRMKMPDQKYATFFCARWYVTNKDNNRHSMRYYENDTLWMCSIATPYTKMKWNVRETWISWRFDYHCRGRKKENWTDLNRNGSECEMPPSPNRMRPKWSYHHIVKFIFSRFTDGTALGTHRPHTHTHTSDNDVIQKRRFPAHPICAGACSCR